MNFIKNNFFYYVVMVILFLGLSCSSWSMDCEKEYKIPAKYLDNGKLWEEDISDQGESGTCSSHAVSECLKYVHGKGVIPPFYLHKQAHYHYDNIDKDGQPAYAHYNTGHSISNLMIFARDYGVPELSYEHTWSNFPNATTKYHGTTKYAFSVIYPAYLMGNGNTPAERIKDVLVKWKQPIAIDVISHIGEENLFRDNTYEIPPHLLEREIVPTKNPIKRSAHAITVYGYSDIEKGFLIKNSWGTQYLSQGKALLPYDYLNKHCNAPAYFGWGIKYINRYYPRPFELETNLVSTKTKKRETSSDEEEESGEICKVM